MHLSVITRWTRRWPDAAVQSLSFNRRCHYLPRLLFTTNCRASKQPLSSFTLEGFKKRFYSCADLSNTPSEYPPNHRSSLSDNQSSYVRHSITSSHSYYSVRQLRHYSSSTAGRRSPVEGFRRIDGALDASSRNYELNHARSTAQIARYAEVLRVATSGGDTKAVERHTNKNKKLLVTDRLRRIFDDAGELLEVSPLAGMGMKYGDIPRGGIVTAIGRISGVYCMVVANDATVKAGTVYPITLKKQLRAMEIAEQNGLPGIFVVDSGGAFLPLQADIFQPGGRTFYNEAILNGLDIPQVAIVCGSCTAGAAYIPTMAQEAIIVQRIGTIFLGGPPLVHAALGEVVTAEELGGAKLHSSVSGCTDYFAGSEEEAFATCRASVSAFNIAPVYNDRVFSEPDYDSAELLGIIPANGDEPMDMYKVLARLVDGSRLHEFKASYAPTIVTGFCHIYGYLVGVVGNNGPLTGDAALKATHFIQLCSQRSIPLILLQNITPSHSPLSSVNQAGLDGDELRNKAKLMSCLACCDVPIVTVVVGNSFGVDSYMMGGWAFNPRFLFRWPNARVCITDPPSLISGLQLAAQSGDPSQDEAAMMKMKAELDQKSSAIHASSQGWDDGVILPQDTRRVGNGQQVLGQCLDIMSQTPAPRRGSQSSKAILRM